MNTSLGDDSCLEHFLQGVEGVSFLVFNSPDFPEASSADDVFKLEISFAYFYNTLNKGDVIVDKNYIMDLFE